MLSSYYYYYYYYYHYYYYCYHYYYHYPVIKYHEQETCLIVIDLFSTQYFDHDTRPSKETKGSAGRMEKQV